MRGLDVATIAPDETVRAYTVREVLEILKARGVIISRQRLSQLRGGKRSDSTAGNNYEAIVEPGEDWIYSGAGAIYRASGLRKILNYYGV